MDLLPPLLLSISANVDTFMVAMSYGMKKIRLSPMITLLIALITSVGTFLSMACGVLLTKFIPLHAASLMGSLLLAAMGVWMVLDYCKTHWKEKKKKAVQPTYSEILADPQKADKDHSGNIDVKESIALAVALLINNVGIGIAASVAGIDIYLNTACTFVVTLLSVALGTAVGNSFLSKMFGKYAGLLAGFLIIVLGLYEAFTI